METSPGRWIEALRLSHDTLAGLIGPLDDAGLQAPSYDDGWTIASVLSHMGSQAEIFGLFLEAGLSGGDPPGPDAFGPIWQAWNARDPRQQADDGLRADDELTRRLEALDADQRDLFKLSLFGMDLDLTGLARMRLAEHALHSWDIAVAMDPAATLAPTSVQLLIDGYDQAAASRVAGLDGKDRRLVLATSSPERLFLLETGDEIGLEPIEGHDGPPDVRLPAEAFLRLVAGRLDPEHTPEGVTGEDHLTELRAIFPGF